MSNAYRIVTGHYARMEGEGKRANKVYGEGDVVRDLTAAEVARLAGKGMIEAVSTPLVVRADDGLDDQVSDAPAELAEGPGQTAIGLQTDAASFLEGHWKAVAKRLTSLDDAEQLTNLIEEEEAGKKRAGVLKEAKARLADLR